MSRFDVISPQSHAIAAASGDARAMLTVLAMTLQAVPVAGPPDVAPRRRAARACPVAVPGEDIVVCARAPDGDRLKPLPQRYARAEGLPKAEVSVLGDARLAVEGEQGADAQGGAINRAMVRLKLPF